jgi:hypothetical protein
VKGRINHAPSLARLRVYLVFSNINRDYIANLAEHPWLNKTPR